MFFVYILNSVNFDKYYIGQANNVEERLLRHNSGYVSSTKPYRPWNLVIALNKESRSEAIILERKLKNLNRVRLQQFIEKYS